MSYKRADQLAKSDTITLPDTDLRVIVNSEPWTMGGSLFFKDDSGWIRNLATGELVHVLPAGTPSSRHATPKR